MSTTTPTCVRCGRPTVDGYVDTVCGIERPRGWLAEIADMVPAARDIAHGLSNHGGTGGHGKPGSRLPLDLGATARLDAVLRTLTRWVNRIGYQRGAARPWFAPHGDEIITAAHWLTDHLEWLRHQPDHDPDTHGNTWGAEQFLTDIEACARIVRGIVRGPAEQRYLGVCGATVTWDDDGNEVPRDAPCEGDVYGHSGAESGTCRACKARWQVATRRAWLDAEVRQRAYRASEIEDAYGVRANLIRQWATPERGMLRVHSTDRIGRRLYLLGEVLDLAVAQKAKAAERAAKREQRAAREAAEMGA